MAAVTWPPERPGVGKLLVSAVGGWGESFLAEGWHSLSPWHTKAAERLASMQAVELRQQAQGEGWELAEAAVLSSMATVLLPVSRSGKAHR